MKKVIYTEDQIQAVISLLNGITTTGIQNANQIAVIAQTLDAGEVKEEKEGEG